MKMAEMALLMFGIKGLMMDNADIAGDSIDKINSEAVEAARGRFDGKSNKNCSECGAEIPKARRDVGGIKLCIDCQSEFERMTALTMGRI